MGWAIRALNNRELNDVYLQPEASNPETYLCIGGGARGYIASGAIDAACFPTLVDSTRAGEPKITLVVGGQAGDYPANWVVDLESVLRAVRAFYDAGGFGTDTRWVNV